MAALAESLANDPKALAALVLGPQGFPEAEDAEAAAAVAPSDGLVDASPPAVDDIPRSAGTGSTWRVMQFLSPLPAEALGRLDRLI